MCFVLSGLNHSKSFRSSLSGLPPPLSENMLMCLRICGWLERRQKVGDSEGLTFLQQFFATVMGLYCERTM